MTQDELNEMEYHARITLNVANAENWEPNDGSRKLAILAIRAFNQIENTKNAIFIAPPDTIAQHAAVNALRAMTPQEVLEWIETAYGMRSEANQRELQKVMGD